MPLCLSSLQTEGFLTTSSQLYEQSLLVCLRAQRLPNVSSPYYSISWQNGFIDDTWHIIVYAYAGHCLGLWTVPHLEHSAPSVPLRSSLLNLVSAFLDTPQFIAATSSDPYLSPFTTCISATISSPTCFLAVHCCRSVDVASIVWHI